jgi:hypothetical protein
MNTATMHPEAARVIAGLTAMHALAETIRDLGTVPAGHLYAQLMHVTDLPGFERAIGALIEAGCITRDRSHLITWTGQQKHLDNLQRVIDNLTAKYANNWHNITA